MVNAPSESDLICRHRLIAPEPHALRQKPRGTMRRTGSAHWLSLDTTCRSENCKWFCGFRGITIIDNGGSGYKSAPPWYISSHWKLVSSINFCPCLSFVALISIQVQFTEFTRLLLGLLFIITPTLCGNHSEQSTLSVICY